MTWLRLSVGDSRRSGASSAAKARPEAAYFTTLSGKRTMFLVFDLASTADIPPYFEPFFQGLNAEIEFAPAMDAADLQKGLASL